MLRDTQIFSDMIKKPNIKIRLTFTISTDDLAFNTAKEAEKKFKALTLGFDNLFMGLELVSSSAHEVYDEEKGYYGVATKSYRYTDVYAENVLHVHGIVHSFCALNMFTLSEVNLQFAQI